MVLANALASIIIYDKDKGVLANSAEVLGGAYNQNTPDYVQERLRHLLFGNAAGDVGVVLLTWKTPCRARPLGRFLGKSGDHIVQGILQKIRNG